MGALSAHLLISVSHVSVLDWAGPQGMLWYIVMFNFQFSNDTQCQQFPCAYLLSVGTLCGEVCFDTVLSFLMLYLLACWPWVSQYYSGWCETCSLQCSFCLRLWEARTPAACRHGCFTLFFWCNIFIHTEEFHARYFDYIHPYFSSPLSLSRSLQTFCPRILKQGCSLLLKKMAQG